LQESRNCKGQYNTAIIFLGPDLNIDKCPIGELFNPICNEVYSLIKSTLLSEFGCGVPPSKLVEELNIYFVYKRTILTAEADFDRVQKE
jgi:hypothetical protein